MKKNMKITFITASFFMFFVFLLNARLPFSHIITFFIQELPFNSPEEIAKFNQTTAKPGKLASKIAHSVASSAYKSIFVTYGGFIVVSDFKGQVTFPRMQQKTDFIVLITEKIEPVIMLGNTIHHWSLLPIPVAAYSVKRKQDKRTKLFYWEVEKTEKPENNVIPLNSIVIFAKPKNIIVPEGITLTNDSPQLILPPMYVVKNSNDIMPALETLKIKQFFGPITIIDKKENNTYYSTQMISTQ